ncbi:1224_t:CDS:2, partial [Gigaspora margarita]
LGFIKVVRTELDEPDAIRMDLAWFVTKRKYLCTGMGELGLEDEFDFASLD